jgi:hypothetical protein
MELWRGGVLECWKIYADRHANLPANKLLHSDFLLLNSLVFLRGFIAAIAKRFFYQPLMRKEGYRGQVVHIKETSFLSIISCLQFTTEQGYLITEDEQCTIEGAPLGKEID